MTSQSVAVEIARVAAGTVEHALVKQQRGAGLAAHNVADGQVVVVGLDLARQLEGGVVAAGDHHHIAHIRVGLIGQEVSNTQLNEGSRE